MPEPKPVDLVIELEEAMYGESVARPDTPQDWWDTLLLEVAKRFCRCSPGRDRQTYDCDVCSVAHLRHKDMMNRAERNG